jgi:hypothetical protein
VSKINGAVILPNDRIRSVRNFSELVIDHIDDFRSIIKEATGLDTRRETLSNNLPRAKLILSAYIWRYLDEMDPDAPVLTLIDISAALCSVRYQQEVRTGYKPYWPGQKDKGESPQRHFDEAIDPDDPFKHQGVLQIYLYRFNEYLCAFTGTADSDRAWMAYQLARLDAYARILNLQDMDDITDNINRFDMRCMDDASKAVKARSFPRSHTGLQ